jgi:hypothetical protein
LLDARESAWCTNLVSSDPAGRPARRGRDKLTSLLMVLAALVWIVAGYFATRKKPADASPASAAEPTVNSTATADPSTTTTSSSSAPSPPAGATDVDACVRGLFPDKAFSKRTPKFDFVCTQTDAVRGASEIKSILVVEGRGGVTQGMRDWAGLEWYALPAFSLMRVTCCAKPPALEWKPKPACPVDEALRKFEEVAPNGSEEAVEAAIEEYGKTARCLDQFNQRRAFGQTGPPGAGGTALKRFLARAHRK